MLISKGLDGVAGPRSTTSSGAKRGLNQIEAILGQLQGERRIRFAISEARTASEINLLPELISTFGDICNAYVNVETHDNFVVDNDVLQNAAVAVQKIAKLTARGEGKFNFTVWLAAGVTYMRQGFNILSVIRSTVTPRPARISSRPRTKLNTANRSRLLIKAHSAETGCP